jgi:hypothetical protein
MYIPLRSGSVQEEAHLSTYLPFLDLATGIFLILSPKFLLEIFYL